MAFSTDSSLFAVPSFPLSTYFFLLHSCPTHNSKQRKENVIHVRASKLYSSSYGHAPFSQPQRFPSPPIRKSTALAIAVDSGGVSKLFPDNSTARCKVILSSLIRHVNEGLQTNQDLRRRHSHPTTAKRRSSSI